MQFIIQRTVVENRATTRTTLRQILASRMLALPAHELRQAVHTELSENPVLELVQQNECPRCGAPFYGACCQVCRLRRRDSCPATFPQDDGLAQRWSVESAPAPEDERALLKLDLAVSAAREDRALISGVLEWVSRDGRLAAPLQEIAASLGVPEAEVEMALRRIREAGPPGFAARDLRECLCLQAEALASQEGQDAELKRESIAAQQILSRHWQSFARGHYSKISRSLGLHEKQVARAAEFIRSHLSPYPGSVSPAAPAAEPDVSVALSDGHFDIELLGPAPEHFCISRPWEQALEDPCLQRRQRASLRSTLGRARLFLEALAFRVRTLRTLTCALVEAEKPFFLSSLDHPVPLKKAELACRAGLHASTVRRALSQKSLLLPDGRLAPFEIFFDASLPVKAELRRILSPDGFTRRLSDSDAAAMLRARGFSVARRTVAKYRHEMGLDWRRNGRQKEREQEV